MRSLTAHFASLALIFGAASLVTSSARAESVPHAAADSNSDRAPLRAELAKHREEQLARLEAYAQAGEFPNNPNVAPSAHLFRDSQGRYCAVANLIHRDGRDALVAQVVSAKNDLVISDVHDGELYRWILGSGLTQEELARIQAPAPFAMRPNDPQMIASIRAHLAQVEAELRRDADRSLELAVDRSVAQHGQS